jgi:predicted nucleic acid-binding protein
VKLLDANVIIRYLEDQETEHGRRSFAFLQRVASGDEQVLLPGWVVAEIVFVLTSPRLYNRPRGEVAERLSAIIELRGTRLDQKEIYIRALELFTQSAADFEDCLSVAAMRQLEIDEVVSFDCHFDRFPGIRRVEP